MKFLPLCLALLLPSLSLAHPADSNSNGRVSAQEMAAYPATNPSPNLLQQAANIFQLGVQGAYTTVTVGNETVHIPANPSRRFVALEKYHAAPFTAVQLGALPAATAPYLAYGSHPGNLAKYFPVSLTEENGDWSITIPASFQYLENGTLINLFIQETDLPLDNPQRLDLGQFHIAPVDTTLADGSYQRFIQDIDSMVASLRKISGINYPDYFVNGSKSLASVNDPFDRLEIGLVCYLQDPNHDGGLRSTLALLREFPEIATEIDHTLDLLAIRSTAPVSGVIADFNTQFTALNANDPASRNARGNIRRTRSFSNNPSAQELLDGMLDAEVARVMLNEPMFAPTAGAANAALGFVGLPGKIVSGSVGITTAILQYRYSRIAFENPSSAKLKAVFSKTTFYQDECNVTGSWTATADASSKGWSADKAAFDLVINAVGALDAAADTAKVVNAFGKSGDVAKAKAALQDVQSFDRRDVAAAASQFGAAESLKAFYDTSPSGNVINIPKKTWTGIPFNENTAQLSSFPAGIMTIGNRYAPQEIGDYTAIISVKDGLYSVGVESTAAVTISLPAASATMTGCPRNYAPGQTYVLSAALEDVANPSSAAFTWSAPWGSLTNPVLSNGVSTVIWTAPDPAPNSPVTITATSTTPLCLPPNAPSPVAFCVAQKNGDFSLQAAPAKDCYDLGDVVTLTFQNLADPEDNFDTKFELVSGVGSLTKTSSNTATFTSSDSTAATILASVVGSTTLFEAVTLNFGCTDFSVKIIQGDDGTDPWLLNFNIGEDDGIAMIVPGNLSDNNQTLSLEFTATTHFNSRLFAEQQENYQGKLESYNSALEAYQLFGAENPGTPPDPPRIGDIGSYFFDTPEEFEARADDNTFNDSEFIYNDQNFNFTISFPYRREPSPFNIPGLVETNTLIFTAPPTVTAIGGPPGSYQLDAELTATELILNGRKTYEIFFVPETN